MTDRDPINWWLSKFAREVLIDPVSTEAVRGIVDAEYAAWHTEELADDITDHFQALHETGHFDQNEYSQSALSGDVKSTFEPLGIVYRISKAHKDTPSTGFHMPGIIDFLAKQDWDRLRSLEPADLVGRDFDDIDGIRTETESETESVMAYLQDQPASDPDGPRHTTPLEAVLYMHTDQNASLLGKDVFVEYGSPSEFSKKANDVAEDLYDESAEGEPLPPFPQHEMNYRYDNCTHFGIVGYVQDVDVVYRPYQLKAGIKAKLQEWAASAFELSFNQFSQDHTTAVTEDAIDRAIHELNESHRDELVSSELFKNRVFMDDDRLVYGIHCRTSKNIGQVASLADNGEEDEQTTD